MSDRNVNPRGPAQRYPNSAEPITNDPKSVDQGHQNSDIDSSSFSQHHTLGYTPNQSSPGHHIHDGSNSKLIPASSITELAGSQTYTPVWTAGATNPVLNNGSLTGRFFQLGKLIFFTQHLVIGSTTTMGSGLYSFSLPIQPVAGSPQFSCYGVINIAGARWPTNGWLDSASSTITRLIASGATAGNSGVSNTIPGAWTTNDFVIMSGWYESA